MFRKISILFLALQLILVMIGMVGCTGASASFGSGIAPAACRIGRTGSRQGSGPLYNLPNRERTSPLIDRSAVAERDIEQVDP